MMAVGGPAHTSMDLLEFYPEANGDGLNITWSHAVNSKDELLQALNGDSMILETDIIVRALGTDHQTNIPVHAHPPATDSDITCEEWIDQVIQTPKKGIKLDFKCLEAVEPTLKILHQKRDKLRVPVLLNADIAVGPNSLYDPIAAIVFIEICTMNFPLATMSLGFTTAWIPGTKSTFTWEMILDILYMVHRLHQPITFPIRAVYLSTSWELCVFLLGLKPSFSISVWSSASDDVDMSGLVKLRKYGGKHRVYFDLPKQQRASLKEALSTADSPEHGMDAKGILCEWNQDLWRLEDTKSTPDNFTLLGTSGVAFLSKDSSNSISPIIHSKQLYELTKIETHPLTISGKLQFIENRDGESHLKVCITSHNASVTGSDATNDISHNASVTGSDSTKASVVLELTISSCGKVCLQNLTTNVSVKTTVPVSESYHFCLCNVGVLLKPTLKVSSRDELQNEVEVELSGKLLVENSAGLGVSFCKEGTAHDLVVQDFAVHF